MTDAKRCWCGNEKLVFFSEDYRLCPACGTLVSQVGLTADQAIVHSDSEDFYGKDYWFSHQTENYGFPDIQQRARQDLPERCLYWLQTLLTYKLPPGKVLELGCAHGGLVALAHWAGFDAVGLELSPWIVDFAHQTFNIPVLQGPVEEQRLPEKSLDAIVLFDVLEHLPDPLKTLGYCISLLKEDGIFIVQMPNYEEGKLYPEMVEQNDLFLEQMKAIEHLHLFSRRAAQQFFERLQFNYLEFKPALFAYDMFFVASRQPLTQHSETDITQELSEQPSRRLVQALLDARSNYTQLANHLKFVEEDRAKAFEIVERFGRDIQILTTQVQQGQDQLAESQTQLYATQTKLAEEQAQHWQTQLKLKDLQELLEQTQQELQDQQAQFQQTQLQLGKARNRVQNQKFKIEALQSQLRESQDEIEAMKASKFWKIRDKWVRFKSLIQK